MPRPIELLAPARDLECGLEAVRHGADAVYIGAPHFGARAAAGNSVDDIATLVRFAHPFGVKIYVTVNTLLYDEELAAVDALIDELQAAGVDALIIQDPRLVTLNRERLPLHASTQMDNRTVDDVLARLDAGYTQTVLARELSLNDIRAIHAAVPDMPLEVFVHGALCVSYSGRCYASEYCFGRSANRGECAQFCRLPFDLLDADGRVVEKQCHLLSLRDMNRAADLEALLDAGATSFKIEGRLKDVSYVKNTTAYYRQHLDAIISRRPDDFCRASYGTSTFTFTPDLRKSFNRRFTDYFLHGRKPDMACFATPKAIGEPVGAVSGISPRGYLQVRYPSLSTLLPDMEAQESESVLFANGDGLCFFDDDNRLQGFRVNRVDEQGRLYPADPSVLASLRKGTALYRNYDAAFERILSRPTAERRIPVRWRLEEAGRDTFRLTLIPLIPSFAPLGESWRGSSSTLIPYPFELARSPQADNIRRQLSRLGDTPFSTTDADITITLSDNWFIPSSILADWRRQLCDALMASLTPQTLPSPPWRRVGEGAPHPSSPSFAPLGESWRGGFTALMTCRYCLRHALGFCPSSPSFAPLGESWRGGSSSAPKSPWSLRLADGRTFPLRFDCQRCEMQVLRPEFL